MSDATLSEDIQEAEGDERNTALAFTPPPNSGLVVKGSAHKVVDTMRRLEAVIAKQGFFKIINRINHSERAVKDGMWLPDMEVLVFGTPRLDAPLMQAAPTIAIDLPLRALVWEDEQGKVWIAYNDMKELAHRHGVTGLDPLFGKISQALDRLTDVAAKAAQKPAAKPAPEPVEPPHAGEE